MQRMYVLAIAILLATTASGQANLTPEIQADLLKTKIVAAYGKGDSKSVLASLDEYRRLKLAMPIPLLWVEARAARQAGSNERALGALTGFLNASDRSSSEYKQALALYPEYEEAVRAEQKRRAMAMLAQLPSQMVSIPGGAFQMGDLAGDGDAGERPLHTVNIKPFKLGKYEVTVGQFRVFILATAYKTEAERNIEMTGCLGFAAGKFGLHSSWSWSSPGFEQSDAQPVVCVSWNDVQYFIQWLNTETGQRFRLPSEAEWEYAARAGSSTKYPWGVDPDQGCSHANGADQTMGPSWSAKMNCSDGYFFTAPVGRYAANALGLHDMIGNVGEWTADCNNSTTYNGAPNDGSPWLSGECSHRMYRSSSWSTLPTFLRVSDRSREPSWDRKSSLGFRLAQDL